MSRPEVLLSNRINAHRAPHVDYVECENELFSACYCDERSDEAIQLDCRGRLRRPRNREVHQERSEESISTFAS